MVEAVNKHMLIYFPFGEENYGPRDAKVNQILDDMNGSMSRLLASLTALTQIDKSIRSATSDAHVIAPFTWRLVEYLTDLFGTSGGKRGEDQRHRLAASLLPAAMTCLDCLPWEDVGQSLLEAMVQYHLRLHPSSSLCAKSFTSIAKVMMVR